MPGPLTDKAAQPARTILETAILHLSPFDFAVVSGVGGLNSFNPMKYIVPLESATGQKLTAMVEEIKAAKKAKRAWLRENGLPLDVVTDTIMMGTGIAGIAFPEKPADWKEVFRLNGTAYYMPMEKRKSVRSILQGIKALPRVRVFECNKVIGWDGFISNYGLTKRGHYWLLDVPELNGVADPAAPGLLEITAAQYKERIALEA